MVEPWAIQLLGGLSARQGARVVTRFATRKTAALLAYLAFRRGQIIPRELVLEVLWPESDLTAARNSLSVALSSLRSTLELPSGTTSEGTGPRGATSGPVLTADRTSVSLNQDAFTTDVAAFEAAIRDPAETSEGLREAVHLYSGELLPGFFEDWVLSERERLADLYRQTLRRLTGRLLTEGATDTALEYAHRAVQADPLGEESRRLLMRTYADIGRPAAVREQLRELERLREEAGEAPPTPETRWLATRLAENADPEKIVSTIDKSAVAETAPDRPVAPTQPATPVASTLPAPPPPVATPAIPGNVPVYATQFFGREPELEAVDNLFSNPATWLVTLTGPGGVGKTRLAVEAARRAVSTGNAVGGVWFIALADITDARSVPEAVRDILRLPRTAQIAPLDQIADHLQGRPSVLVLDNLEHLLGRGPLDPEGIAAFVRALHSRLPELSLIATSRQALGIAGEAEYPVPLLAVPDAADLTPADLLRFPSVQLFADRARARRVDFQVTPRNAETVARLVARLEGIPLALELAAAWSKLLTPARMLERLEEPTDSSWAAGSARFNLLVSRNTDLPKRHQTLIAALEWGYALLSPESRRLLAAASVFRGGWTVTAAETVCESGAEEARILPEGRTLECLTALRDASLLVTTEEGAEMRLGLLETVREFAEGRLTEDERVSLERRHADYFRAFVEEAYANIWGAEQKTWFDRLEADLPNLRMVMERFAQEDTGLVVAAGLSTFWKLRGYYREGRAWLTRILAAPLRGQGVAIWHTRAWQGLGFLSEDIGDFAAAEEAYRHGEAIARAAGEEKAAAAALNNLGNLAYRRGDNAAARILYTEVLHFYQRIGSRRDIAGTLGNLGNVAQNEGDIAEARRLQEESLVLSRETGDARMTAYTLHNLGNIASAERDFSRARSLYEESMIGKRALGDRRGVATLLASLGFVELLEEQYDVALPLYIEALKTLLELGNKIYLLTSLDGLAYLASRTGQYDRAARLWAAAAAAHERLSNPYTEEESINYGKIIAESRAVSPTTWDAAWEAGSHLSLEEATQEALALASEP